VRRPKKIDRPAPAGFKDSSVSHLARSTFADLDVVRAVLRRIAVDLGTILGKDIALAEARCERAHARPAGEGCIHISFKLAFRIDGADVFHGCLLVPLPEAIAWGGLLLMLPEDAIAARREESTLDPDLKQALLEIGNVIAGAVHTALAELGLPWRALSQGCQGVRADVRPALPYVEGTEVLVGRVDASIGALPTARWLAILPVPA